MIHGSRGKPNEKEVVFKLKSRLFLSFILSVFFFWVIKASSLYGRPIFLKEKLSTKILILLYFIWGWELHAIWKDRQEFATHYEAHGMR